MWRRILVLGLAIWPAAILMGSLTHEAAAVSFSAERVVKRGKSVVTAHVNAKDDRWRFEFTQPQGGASIIIVRMDHGASWPILSKRRQYLELPGAHDHRLVVTEAMEGEISREFVGEETLNGNPTELFEVTVKDRDETRQYYRWVTKTQRFPLKTVSKSSTVTNGATLQGKITFTGTVPSRNPSSCAAIATVSIAGSLRWKWASPLERSQYRLGRWAQGRGRRCGRD